MGDWVTVVGNFLALTYIIFHTYHPTKRENSTVVIRQLT